MSALVEATIDGQAVRVAPGTTIFDAARGIGITIPTVCHLPPQDPVGVCRVCVVEVGERVLAAACARPVAAGMKVVTANEKIATVRRTLLELLMADHDAPCARQKESGDCELELRAQELGARRGRYHAGPQKRPPIAGWTPADDSHPNIAVDHAACIVCDRCVRACTDVAHNFVIGRAGKGNATVITFDAGRPMGESSCVSCGECLVSCPTGALMNKGFGEARIPGTPVAAEALLAIRGPEGDRPLLDGISPKFLAKTLGPIGRNDGAVVERRFRPGEVICREGDFGSTAFYVVRGKVEVAITTTRVATYRMAPAPRPPRRAVGSSTRGATSGSRTRAATPIPASTAGSTRQSSRPLNETSHQPMACATTPATMTIPRIAPTLPREEARLHRDLCREGGDDRQVVEACRGLDGRGPLAL